MTTRSARFVLLTAGLLAPLLALELALRTLGPFLPGDYQTAAFSIRAAPVGSRNAPNVDGWRKTTEFTTWVRINPKGLRGPEVPYEKPPGTYRILALGDSFTFALQVNEEQTFEQLLAERLNADSGGARLEVLNSGVDGWSTANEYEWLASEGYKYSPDLVLVMFYVGNDPGDNADQLRSPEAVEQFHPGEDRTSLLSRAREALARRSLAYSLIEYGALAKLGGRRAEDALGGGEDRKLDPERRLQATRDVVGQQVERPFWGFDTPRKIRGWAISEALLRRLRAFCAARGSALLVVEIPTAGQVTYPELTATPLPTIGARAGVPVIDLLAAFREEPQRDGLYFPQNGHWTAAGHAVVARTLAEALRARGLIPRGEG